MMAVPSLASATLDALYPPVDAQADADREAAEEIAASLRLFVPAMWRLVKPAVPYVGNWHIDNICEHLQAVSDGELPRLIINQPPRTSKSLTGAVFWPAWEWLRKPHLEWLYATYAQSFSVRDSNQMRRLIQTEGGMQDGSYGQRVGYQGLLRLLGEDWTLRDDQNTKTKYETTAGGQRFATSVGGIATGEGGDRIVVDDPTNANQARSDVLRDAANLWWDETMESRFNNKDAAAVIVMQRLHEDDLTGHLLAAEDSDWHHLCLPAEYEPKHPFVYPAHVELPSGRVLPGDPRTEQGQPLDEDRLDPKTIAQRKARLGSYGYAGQYQQTPTALEGGMFKQGWWSYYEPGDEWEGTLHKGWDSVIQSWDMRFSDNKQKNDWVVGQLWGFHGANAYLLGQIRGRLSFTESQQAIRDLTAWSDASKYGAFRPGGAKLVEKKANGDAIIQTLRSTVGGIIPVNPSESKEARAAAVTPLVEAGNVWLPPSNFIPCPPGYEATSVSDFVEEHASFPRSTHDDQVDCLSQALSWRRPTERVAVAPVRRAPARPTVGLRDRPI